VEGDQRRGIRAAIAAYVLWGSLTIYWKQLDGFDPVELIGWRIALAAIVMAVVVSVGHRWDAIFATARTPRLLGRVAVASVLLTVNWTTYVWAVVNEEIIQTALGYFLAPLGTTTIGVLVLGERLDRAKKVAIVFAVAAVAVLTISAGRVPVAALVIAATWSLYGLAKRQVPLGPVESLASETFVLIPVAVAVVAWGATRSDGVVAVATGLDWVFLAGTGIITAVPLLLFAVAARSVPFTLLGPLNYLVPIVNFLIGWLLYDEPLPLGRAIGFFLVWCALVIVTIGTVRSARRSPAAVPAGVG
jgi:chloramphenicol-sensitive protein RarD